MGKALRGAAVAGALACVAWLLWLLLVPPDEPSLHDTPMDELLARSDADAAGRMPEPGEAEGLATRESVIAEPPAEEEAPPVGPFPVAGRVLRHGSGEPVRDLPLQLMRHEGTHDAHTDGEGRFRFPAVEEGGYRLLVKDEATVLLNYLQVDRPLEDLLIEAPAGMLEIYVEAYDPAVLEGAIVRLVSEYLGEDAAGSGNGNRPLYLASGLENGIARFRILPTGAYRGRVQLRDDADGAPDVTLRVVSVGGNGQWSRAHVQVAPPVTVQVRVQTPFGDPVPGAAVHVHGIDRTRLAEVAATGAEGVAEALLRERGYPMLSAYADRASGWTPLVEPLFEAQELTVVVQPGVRVVAALVHAEDGEPVTQESRHIGDAQLPLTRFGEGITPVADPYLRLGGRERDARRPLELYVGALQPGRYLQQVLVFGERIGTLDFTVPESFPVRQVLRLELAIEHPEFLTGETVEPAAEAAPPAAGSGEGG